MQLCPPTFLTYLENISPPEGLRGTGGTAETLSAERGTGSFAVTAGEFFSHLRTMVFEDLQIAN